MKNLARRSLSVAMLCAAVVASGVVCVDQAVAAGAAAPITVPPRPDHVVIVVEENHSSTSILGNPDAPFINALAAANANFTQSFAEYHPSQPNYIAMFSGGSQGVTDDSCPLSLSGENLATQLIGAGLTFGGYSEGLPGVGSPACYSGKYARKHSPWANYANVPSSTNMPITSLPADYSQLPTVSFVIPNLDNDMHDGTVAQGDTWLRDNLNPYIQWAKAHNSLFVLTFDEDDNKANNQIATIIAGQRVQPGAYADRINHYSLLRTIQDAYGLGPLGASATAAPILNVWNDGTGNQNPTAAFSSTVSGAAVAFDASASSDPDGTVAAYSWDWGDVGSPGTGATPSHTYAAAGTYTVTLTVTDNNGATNTVAKQVTAGGGAQVVASDAFGRTAATGWGTADLGGAWSLSTTSPFLVSGNGGKIRGSAGSGLTATLPTPQVADVTMTSDVFTDKDYAGGGLYFSLSARQVGTSSYRLRAVWAASGKLNLQIDKNISGAQTPLKTIQVPGLTLTAGDVLRLRFSVTGSSPATLNGKVWKVGTSEPAAWQLTATDTTALLAGAGAVGLQTYLSSAATNAPVTATVDNFSAAGAGGGNQSPTAVFSSTPAGLAATFDSTGSTDPDGTITGYAWKWDDNTPDGTGPSPTHTYSNSGTYNIRLTVTDNSGATATITHPVTFTAANQKPLPAFTSTIAEGLVTLDSSGSTDPDGTITGYAWKWDDNTPDGTGPSPTHTYTNSGTYNIALTVTDNSGTTATITHPVTITAPNQKTTARFSLIASELVVSVDGTGSTDSDGIITAYTWNWGDSSVNGVGPTATHTYQAPGTYTVTLTVSDSDGVTDTSAASYTLTATGGPFAADTFSRSVTNGWGSADAGGAWNASTPSTFSVAGGMGLIKLTSPGSGPLVMLKVGIADVDVAVDLQLDKTPTGNGVYTSVAVRRIGTSDYRLKVVISAKSVTAFLVRTVNGSETILKQQAISGLAPTARLRMRIQAVGASPTTVSARIWASASSEPSTWAITTVDNQPSLQAAGAIALSDYLSSSATSAPITAAYDNLIVTAK